MNVEKLNEFADTLETSETFDMGVFSSDDGPGCIVGHMAAFFDREVLEGGSGFVVSKVSDFFGLEKKFVEQICYPHRASVILFPDDEDEQEKYSEAAYKIDHIQAAKVVRHLAETGEVNHLV